jgi:hypothetical protein
VAEEESQEVLLRIVRCPHIVDVLEEHRIGHRCARIVGIQETVMERFQLPEPWSGDLEHAPILFLGSNPGYAASEEYPLWAWKDEEVVDFFQHRFGDGQKEWVKDSLYPLLNIDGCGCYDQKKNWVRYWAAVRRRAAELLGTRGAVPGVDYAMSEVVHCKSKGETGVSAAVEVCVPLYLERLLAVAGAKVVVCLGMVAGGLVREKWGVSTTAHIHGPVEIGGRQRYFAFLPHPNSRGPRSFNDRECISTHELTTIQHFLA